jgi:ferric-dicitrate binding protein FerR (iron transport regulator)
MDTGNIPWNSIGAFLKDQSDKESEIIIKRWMSVSPEHVRLFNEIADINTLTGQAIDFYRPRKEELWLELMQRIRAETKIKATKERRIWLSRVAVAAALVAAFFTGSLFSFDQDQTPDNNTVAYTKVIAPLGHRTQLVLPDSTKVWLNSGAELQYPSSFNGEARDVYTRGECYFEVTKNRLKPFVVHGTGIRVKVYGTKFNMRENENQRSLVTLLDGKVEVLNRANKSLCFLEPGQQLAVEGRNGEKMNLLNVADPEALIAWTNNMLVFEDHPFEEVIGDLENWYGVTIHLDRSLQNKHNYTFKVKTESLREVLDLISVISPIDYQVDGDQIYINKK